MLTVKKLLSLHERTRIRKISMILAESAHQARIGNTPDLKYINEILPLAELPPLDVCSEEKHLDGKAAESELDNGKLCNSELYNNGLYNSGLYNCDGELCSSGMHNNSNGELYNSALYNKELAFKLEDYAQALLTRLGAEPSDWDFTDSNGELDVSKRVVQDKVLVLDRLRSPFNVGAVFRSADSFGIKKIILVEGTASPEHQRARRTSRGCINTVEWCFMKEADVIECLSSYPEGQVLALEPGGSDINTFDFPVRGAAVLGSEEFGISPGILSCCTARVSIPMGGTKGSLNVSVAAGIMLQKWYACTLCL